jgi:hypothetical protein
MLHTNLDTLLFCRNLQCRKLLQVSEYGPFAVKIYNATRSRVRFQSRNIFFCLGKRSCLHITTPAL